MPAAARERVWARLADAPAPAEAPGRGRWRGAVIGLAIAAGLALALIELGRGAQPIARAPRGEAARYDGAAPADERAMAHARLGEALLWTGETEAASRAYATALAVVDEMIDGPVVLVGSSMGGWIMLLVALADGTGRVVLRFFHFKQAQAEQRSGEPQSAQSHFAKGGQGARPVMLKTKVGRRVWSV